MDVQDLIWLRAIRDCGSFRVAAGQRVAVSTVARRIDALERHLGLRLVDRRADGVRLTKDGARIADLAAPVVDAADRLGRAAAAMQDGATVAPIVVSATEFFVTEVLAPRLPTLFAGVLPIVVTLRTETGIASLAGRDADLAIRMTRPSGDSLVARRLLSMELGLFAHRSYVGRRDTAGLELSRERLLVYDDGYGSIPENAWVDAFRLGSAVALRAGSIRALANAAAAGAGIALLPAVFGRRLGLVEIAVEPPGPRPTWVVVHRDLRRVPAITAVREWLVAACRAWFDESAPDTPPRRRSTVLRSQRRGGAAPAP